MHVTQYKQLFLQEARTKLKEFEDVVLQLEKKRESGLLIDKALVILHALKGDAATMNFLQLANAAHAVEEFFITVKKGSARFTPSDIDHLFILIDAFRTDLVHIQEKDTEIDLGPSLAFIMRADRVAPAEERAAVPDPHEQNARTDDPYAPLGSFVDVPTERLEEALALANELIASNQQTQRLLRNGDIGGIKIGLFNLATRASTMRQAVIEMKMIPVRQYFVFLARLVRDLARQKRAFISFVFRDNHLRFERQVLDSLRDICVQLIKNAVDHGFREGDYGTVTLTFEFRNDKIHLAVQDSGHGIDWQILKKRAIAAKHLSASSKMTPEKQQQLLFVYGVSSREHASLVSGRGIGLPSVRATAESLGGQVTVTSSSRGTRFDIYASITPTLFRALTWHWGPYALALPLFAVEKVIQLPQGPEQTMPKQFTYRGVSLKVIDLSTALGMPAVSRSTGLIDAIAIVSVNDVRKALALPPGFMEQELILQPLASLKRFSSFSGVAVSEESTPIMIINHRTL